MRKPRIMEIFLPVMAVVAGWQIQRHLPVKTPQSQKSTSKSELPDIATALNQDTTRYTRDKIFKIVKNIVVEKLGVDTSEVKPEASFTNDLGADSLDTVELIMEFEKTFNISI